MIEKKIKFMSTISDGIEQLDHDFSVRGTIYLHEDGTLKQLDFPEPVESGLTLETSILMLDGTMSIVRDGAISMAQEFVLGEQVAGTYETEEGTLDTSVYTTVLEVNGDKDSGEIYLVYDLYIDNEYASKVSVTIEYE